MAWRTSPLPAGWSVLRRAVLERDGYRCTWFPGQSPRGSEYRGCYGHPYRCSNKATEVDHVHSNTDHSMNNLRSICKEHHSSKTSSLSHEEINKRSEEHTSALQSRET